MSVYSGLDIVTDGLILALDATSEKSYSTGTTWYNIAGQNKNATLSGTPPTSDGLGSIVFNGTNDSGQIISTDLNLGNEGTVEIVYNFPTGKTGAGTDLLLGAWGNYSFYSNSNSGDNKFWQIIYYDPSGAYVGSAIYPSADTWYHNISSFNEIGEYKKLINGTNLYTQTAVDFTGWRSNLSTLYFGGLLSETKIMIIRIYNRALSVDEMTQNYNAIKSRFN